MVLKSLNAHYAKLASPQEKIGILILNPFMNLVTPGNANFAKKFTGQEESLEHTFLLFMLEKDHFNAIFVVKHVRGGHTLKLIFYWNMFTHATAVTKNLS